MDLSRKALRDGDDLGRRSVTLQDPHGFERDIEMLRNEFAGATICRIPFRFLTNSDGT